MEQKLTVEDCLKELREMFPERWRLISVEVNDKPTVGQRSYCIYIQNAPLFPPRPNLEEAIARVRAWKEQNG